MKFRIISLPAPEIIEVQGWAQVEIFIPIKLKANNQLPMICAIGSYSIA